jgi:hypothetical protein
MTARAKKGSGTKRKRKNFRGKQSGSRWSWLNAGIVVALVGVIGAVLAAVVPHYLDASTPSAPNLEVDSVTAQSYVEQHASLASDSDGSPGYETLDFKLRNTGGQLAFITGVRITVHSLRVLQSSDFGTFVPVSALYGFVIPIRTGTFTAPVSEDIEPGQADRFELNISLPRNTGDAQYIYGISLALVYDKGNAVNAGQMSLDLSPGYIRFRTVQVSSPPPSIGD